MRPLSTIREGNGSLTNGDKTMTTTVKITETSLKVFLAYADDAPNWSGTPLIGGNVGGGKEERGNLTQLKKAGLITTFESDGEMWIDFTDAGRKLAHRHGLQVGGYKNEDEEIKAEREAAEEEAYANA